MFEFIDKEKRMGLAMILANYAKRKLEETYDNFAESDFGQTIQNMDSKSKYALELVLYLISAIADRKLDEKSFLTKIIKEISVDATPELAKRFLDGEKNSVKNNAEFVWIILMLRNELITELIEWLSGYDEARRNLIIQKIEKLSKEELEKILRLEVKEREITIDLLPSKKPKKKFSEKVEGQLDAIIRNLKNKET
jgi:hypothetical protein